MTEGGRLSDGNTLGPGVATAVLGNRGDDFGGCAAVAGAPKPAKAGVAGGAGDEGFNCVAAGVAEKMPPPGALSAGGFDMPKAVPPPSGFCPKNEV